MKKIFKSFVVIFLSVMTILITGAGCTAKAKMERHLKKAEEHFKNQAYETAEIEYLNVLRYDRSNTIAYARLGTILLDQGLHLKALQALQNAFKQNPKNTEVQLKFAQALFTIGMQNYAREEAINVLTQNPKQEEALMLLAKTSQGTNALLDAESRLAAYRQKNGESAPLYLAYSILLVRRGEFSAAEAAAQKSLSMNPKLSDAHLAVAEFALSKSNLTLAESEFKQAAELAPLRSLTHIRYAEYKLTTGKKEDAIKILKEITDKAPDYTVAWRIQAQMALDEGKPEEAIQLINRVLFRDAGNFDGLYLRARAQMGLKQFAKALQDLESLFAGVTRVAKIFQEALSKEQEKAASTAKSKSSSNDKKAKTELAKKSEAMERAIRLMFFPALPEAYCLAALAYDTQNDANKTASSLKAAITHDPGSVQARVLLTKFNLRKNFDVDRTIKELSQFFAFMEQRFNDAEAKVGKTNLVASPKGRLFVSQYYEVALLLAEIHSSRGQFEEAAKIYRNLIAENPKNPAFHLSLGMVLRQQKKEREARSEFEEILRLDPGSTQALFQLTQMDLAVTNQTAALQRLQGETAKNPKSAPLYYLQGLTYYAKTNTYDKAEAALQKCLELDNNYNPGYTLLAQLYLKQQQKKDAIEKLAALFEKDPRDLRSAMILAGLHTEEKQFDKARQIYEKILSIQTNFFPAMNNLTYMYCEHYNLLDKAYELGKRAYNLAPGNPLIADTYGWVLYRRGDFQQAMSLIQEGAQKLSHSAEVQYHLGMVYYMFGQTDAARAAFQQALNTKEEYPGKEEAQKRLAMLQSNTGKNPAQAISDLEKTVKDNPKDLVALIRLGELYKQQNQAQKAADTFEQATKVNSQSVTPILELAKLLGGPLQDKAKAMVYAKKARELAPVNNQVAHVLGQLHYQAGDFAQAYKLLDEAKGEKNSDSELARDYAWAAYSLGKLDEAKEAMQQVQAAQGQSPALVNDARWFLLLLGYHQNPQNVIAAENQVNEILKSNTGYVPGLFVKGLILNQRGQPKEAVATFENVLVRFPQFWPAQRALAVLYSNDPAQEKKSFDLALKARVSIPDDPMLAKVLGKIYHNRKEFSNAVRSLEEAVTAMPTDAESLYYLGNSYLQLKDKVKAKATIQKAVSAGLKSPLDVEAKRILGTL